MTEGWKCLETSYRALQKVMESCGKNFGPFLTDSLRDLIYRSLLHPNRSRIPPPLQLCQSSSTVLPRLSRAAPSLSSIMGTGDHQATVCPRILRLFLTPYPLIPVVRNRFIREIGFFVVCSMVHAMPHEQLVSLATELAKQLVDGLSDNWSQASLASPFSP